MASLNQCDCCDYFTVPEGEDYEICPVCFWEQDAFGIEYPDLESGANHGLTLREGRTNFKELGACLERFIDKVIPIAERGKFRHEPRSI